MEYFEDGDLSLSRRLDPPTPFPFATLPRWTSFPSALEASQTSIPLDPQPSSRANQSSTTTVFWSKMILPSSTQTPHLQWYRILRSRSTLFYPKTVQFCKIYNDLSSSDLCTRTIEYNPTLQNKNSKTQPTIGTNSTRRIIRIHTKIPMP